MSDRQASCVIIAVVFLTQLASRRVTSLQRQPWLLYSWPKCFTGLLVVTREILGTKKFSIARAVFVVRDQRLAEQSPFLLFPQNL